MFLDKFITDNKHQYRQQRKFYKPYTKGKVLILSKEVISQKIFEDIANVVDSDLRIGDFNYRGRTLLQIQLLADLDNKGKITLIRIQKRAIVVIR